MNRVREELAEVKAERDALDRGMKTQALALLERAEKAETKCEMYIEVVTRVESGLKRIIKEWESIESPNPVIAQTYRLAAEELSELLPKEE